MFSALRSKSPFHRFWDFVPLSFQQLFESLGTEISLAATFPNRKIFSFQDCSCHVREKVSSKSHNSIGNLSLRESSLRSITTWMQAVGTWPCVMGASCWVTWVEWASCPAYPTAHRESPLAWWAAFLTGCILCKPSIFGPENQPPFQPLPCWRDHLKTSYLW